MTQFDYRSVIFLKMCTHLTKIYSGMYTTLQQIWGWRRNRYSCEYCNTAPAVFWMPLYLYSHPGILKDIRREVGSIMTSSAAEPDTSWWSLDITSVETDCPLLASTFQKVLRHRSMGTSIRQVVEDTVLDGEWFLKKDCLIEMPSRVLHKDPSVWGSDVDDINPRRFMSSWSQIQTSKSSCFRERGTKSGNAPLVSRTLERSLRLSQRRVALRRRVAEGRSWKKT